MNELNGLAREQGRKSASRLCASFNSWVLKVSGKSTLIEHMKLSSTSDPMLKIHSLGLAALLCFGAALLAGCGVGKSGSGSFASVKITGKTPEEICKATAAVFQEDGYQVRALTPSQMVFEKEGSRGQSLAYSGVVDTHYGATTVVRVRAQLVDLGAGSSRLQCQAYMVRNANDSFFQDESRLINARSVPYQSLLNKVAKRLKS